MITPHSPATPSQGRDRHGMVLLVVIIIVALLSLAGYAFVALMNSELDSARQRGREIQVQYVTQSGVSLLESVATLPQYDRQWAGGTYDNPTLFCAAAMEDGTFGAVNSARFTVVAPKIEDGRMAGVRYGMVNESAKLNLAKVLEWETARPGDGVEALRKLPGMTVSTAEAILDWIDPDDNPRSGGAEADWYARQRLPYRPRNAVPVTLEEFLLVRGVTRQLMFGDDENCNFVPDAQETRMAGYAPTAQPATGATPQPGMIGGNAPPAVPWVHLLTVISAERDANPRGAARIDLNGANLEFLHAQLAERVNLETADFVVLYRQYGTAELVAQATAAQQAAEAQPPAPTARGSSRGARGSQSATSRRGSRLSQTASSPDTPPGLSSDMPPGAGNRAIDMPPDPPGSLDSLDPLDPNGAPPPLSLGGPNVMPNDLPNNVPGGSSNVMQSAASGDMSGGMPGAMGPSNMTGTAPPPLEISETPDALPANATTVGSPATSRTTSRASSRSSTGATSRGHGGSRTVRESRFSQYVNLQTPAQFRLETPLDIVGATVAIPQNAAASPTVAPTTTSTATAQPATATPVSTGGATTDAAGAAANSSSEPAAITLDSPLTVDSSSLNSTLLTYLDETSTAASTTIVGRININEAPYEVIAGIPGLSQNAVRQIVNRREQPANGVRDMYRHPTWLLAHNIVDLATLKKIWPHVTCGGDIFRGQVISFYEDIGTFSRVEAAVDATVYPPRLVDYKDLTSHGIGFHDRVLFGNIPRQGPAGVAGSTAPTFADYGGGTGFADAGPGFSGADGFSNMGMSSGMNTGMMGTQPMQPMQQPTYTSPSYSDIAPLEL